MNTSSPAIAAAYAALISPRFPGVVVRADLESPDGDVVLDVLCVADRDARRFHEFLVRELAGLARTASLPFVPLIAHTVSDVAEHLPAVYEAWLHAQWAATARSMVSGSSRRTEDAGRWRSTARSERQGHSCASAESGDIGMAA